MTVENGFWTRRAVVGGALAGAAMSAAAAGDPLSGAALYADVVRYAGLGEHRTGTEGDLATSDWLESELKAAGCQVERQSFAVPVFDFKAASVEGGGGARLDGFPIWTPQAGEAAGPLSTEARPGAVAVLSFPPGTGAALGVADAYRKPIQAAIAAGAVAVVAITENPLGELVAFNAPSNTAPWTVPVVAVAGREGPGLLTAARAGAVARIRLEGVMKSGVADNLVARGTGKGKPLIVSTPKSGWFRCAGERGSGLAIWLGLARRFAASDRSFVFMAASGHEFDGYGGRLFAEQPAPKPAEARGWVHIGANVAAYDFALDNGKIVRQTRPQSGRRLAVSEKLLPAARQAFAGQPGYAEPADIDVSAAPGEIAEYQRRGYAPLIGMVGLHPLHHTRRDRPDVTGPELLEPVARGLATLIEQL